MDTCSNFFIQVNKRFIRIYKLISFPVSMDKIQDCWRKALEFSQWIKIFRSTLPGLVNLFQLFQTPKMFRIFLFFIIRQSLSRRQRNFTLIFRWKQFLNPKNYVKIWSIVEQCWAYFFQTVKKDLSADVLPAAVLRVVSRLVVCLNHVGARALEQRAPHPLHPLSALLNVTRYIIIHNSPWKRFSKITRHSSKVS